MGRYYRSSVGANEIDYMYKVPENLMMKVVQNADEQVDALGNNLGLLDNALAKVNYLEPDKQRVTEINNQYKSKIDELSGQISKDPANWRKYMGGVKDLSRTIQNDYTSGELGSIQKNYSAYEGWLKQESERMKTGKITGDQLQRNRASVLSNFAGTQYKPGQGGNVLSPGYIPDYMDVNKELDDVTKDIKPISIGKAGTSVAGQWLIEHEGKQVYVTPERAQQIALARVQGNSKIMSFLKNEYETGSIKDIDKFLSQQVGAAVLKNSYMNSETKTDRKMNPVWAHNDSEAQTNARQSASFAHAEKMEQINQTQADNKYEAQLQGKIAAKVPGAEKELEHWAGLKNGSIDPAGKVSIEPVNGKINYEMEAKSHADMVSNYRALDNQIDSIKQQMLDPEMSADVRANLKDQLIQKQIQRNNTFQVADAANKFGMAQMLQLGYSKEDISELFKYRADPNYKSQLEAQSDKSAQSNAQQAAKMGGWLGLDIDSKGAGAKITRLDKMNNQWTKTVNNWTEENNKKQNKEIATVSVPESQGKQMAEKLGPAVTSMQVLDMGGTKSTDKFKDKDGKTYNMDFSEQGIMGYVKASGKKLSDVIKVDNLVGTIPGKGNAVQISFVDKDIRGGKTITATVPPENLMSLLNGYNSGTNNPMGKEVVSTIIDNRKQSLITDLTNAYHDFQSGSTIPYTTQVTDKEGNKRMMQVVPVIDNGEVSNYKVLLSDKAGNLIERGGSYKSVNDIVNTMLDGPIFK